MKYISSPKILQELLAAHGFHIKKNFGQNFLIDGNILQKIIATAGIAEGEIALEIGPGVGALTQLLAQKAHKVYCFEIDHSLEQLLAETLADCENVEIKYQDFLKIDLATWFATIEQKKTIKVIANLPYYITTPILEKLIIWYVTYKPNLISATVMMQKEVALRLSAVPKTKEYGSLSIFMQLFAEIKVAFIVPKTVFIPVPNVASAVVHIQFKPNDNFATYEEANLFLAFVRLGFRMRRKTLVNNLQHLYDTLAIKEALKELSISESVRAEALTSDNFLDLFQILGIVHKHIE